MMTACSGLRQAQDDTPPNGAVRAMPQSRAIRQTLLYTSSITTNLVSIFVYPKGAPAGSLSGFEEPLGLCSNAAGDVFVVDGKAQTIVKFAHGRSVPIDTLDDAGNEPYGCSINAQNGDLAVAGGFPEHGVPANVALYHKGKGSATIFTDPAFAMFYWCAFDGRGDLFLEGSYGGSGAIDELPSGATQFVRLSVDTSFGPGGAIEWDGRYLVVADNPASHQKHGPATLYQFQVSGTAATLINTIRLSTGKRNLNAWGTQFRIDGAWVIAPKTTNANVARWPYPAGGKPNRTFKVDSKQFGATLSR
jgi:hypothetical protein